jgi:hypothetical protein
VQPRSAGTKTRGTALPEDNTSTRSPISHLYVALALHAVLVAVVVRWIGIYAWDDGAITLAFSKTFAEAGQVALTAASEQVEGFSSISWFVVNAVLALFRPSFEGAIMMSQIATGVCLGLSLLLVWRLARHFGLRSETTLAVLVTLALFGPSLHEVANGMEMTLLAASGLMLIYTLHVRRSPALFAIVAAVFLAARFEAMIYYAALLAPLLYQKRYRSFFVLAILGLIIVGIQEWLRLALFGDYVPNTIRAKVHPPYASVGSAALYSHYRGGLEALASMFPLVLGAGAALVLSGFARADLLSKLRAPWTIPDTVIILLAPIAAVIVFVTAIGKTWGYTGRMEFLALPCGLILVGLMWDRYVVDRGGLSGKAEHMLLVIVTTGIILLSWHESAAKPISVALANAGGDEYRNRADVNPATYRETAGAVALVGRLAGLDTVVLVTPDVGGVGLCCRNIRVIDLGLLTHQQLAREGYRAFPEVFAKENPDVLAVHLMWAELSGIYDLRAFQEYQPAIVRNTRLYVRQDLVAAMARHQRMRFCEVREPTCRAKALQRHRYAADSTERDDRAFLEQGRILLLE